jgi:hypothetical protein
MKLLKLVHNMSVLDLHELQEAVITEIQRRKALVLGGPAVESAEPEPAAAVQPEIPDTLPGPSRRVSRMPRRLRRAA